MSLSTLCIFSSLPAFVISLDFILSISPLTSSSLSVISPSSNCLSNSSFLDSFFVGSAFGSGASNFFLVSK